MSKQDHAATINTLMKRAKAAPAESPIEGSDAIAELVFSFLLWEAPFTRARTAYKRLADSVINHNDLRVTRIDDVAGILGKTYPMALERSERLNLALEEIYRREYAVSLDNAAALGKREGRKYLESIDDTPPFVSARTSLVAFGSHAVPLDDRTMARLLEHDVFEEGTATEQAIGTLERAVKASDAPEFHARMVSWMDGPAGATTRKKTTKKSSPARAKTTKKKTKRSTA